MIRTLPLALVLTAAAPAATARSGERHFDVGRFDAIELASSDDVRVVPGDTVSVTAGGDPRAVAALAIGVRGSSLRIGRRPGTWRDRGAVVTVVVPALRAVAISGSGDVQVVQVSGAGFSGSVSGSGDLTLSDVKVGQARFAVNGSGSITAAGRVAGAVINVSGSGEVDTSKLTASDVTIAVAGSGDVIAAASRAATVSLGGSGSVRVTGGARCTVSRGGSGAVNCG